MCGRFTLTVNPAEFEDKFGNFIFPQQFAPRFNIAPSQPTLAIPNNDRFKADFFTWGLVPMWAKDPMIGHRLINARSETLAEKPSFRGSLKYKRCLVFADGFYEWKTHRGKKAKTPFYIYMKDRQPFAFAGLWDTWSSSDGSYLRSCALITTVPNKLMETIHNRMPAILHPRDYAAWLDPSAQTPNQILPLIKPYPAEDMDAHPVSALVNNAHVDAPEMILPAQ
ncbi:MAG: SOS response-associated peptidase [Anaerolineales bacterium]|nr:SOS response-associated peptidase [Anaerolineales bacterium]MCL4260181.1 SOS response-associated peptidase [Anaerolineales bacterium]